MRVLLVSNLYPPYWIGGYEQVAQWVAGGLAARGHAVAILTGRGPAFQGRPDVYPDLDLDLPALLRAHEGAGIAFEDGLLGRIRTHVFSRRNYTAGLRAIKAFRPDLVSFWNPAFVTFSPLLAAARSSVPAVVHFSDVAVNPFRNPRRPSFPAALVPVARAGVDLVLRMAGPRRIVVPSQFLKDRLAATESMDAGRIEVLAWPAEAEAGREAGEPRSGPRILFVGSLLPEKGPQVLIEAFRLAHREHPELSLTLVGEGPQACVSVLQQAAAGLPVRLLGRQDRAGVLAAYRGHDTLVLPSTWDEPYALVPLEAMAMGLAVIATRSGGTPEAAVDGKTALLVPPGDHAALAAALLCVVREPRQALERSIAAQAWVRAERGFDGFMDRLEGLYRSLVA